MTFYGRSVLVNEGNVEKALRKFKKKIQNSGILLELRERETYIKPTTRRKTKKSLARKRWQRYIETQKIPPKLY
jgi:small subunit ribosomal protein S21